MTTDDTYPNAGRDSGYTDADGRPVGENVINRVTELMIGPQTKLIQLAAQLDATVKVQDQRFQYVLGQLSDFLDKEDARHLVYDQAEQSTLAALTSVAHRLDEITSYVQQSVTIAREALTVSKAGAARLGKMEKDVRSLAKRMVASEADRKNIHSEVAGVKGDVADVRSDVAALQRQFASYIQGFNVEEVRTQLRELRGEYTPEQRQRYTAILMDMIAAWEADHGNG